jgi:hypothetical protein
MDPTLRLPRPDRLPSTRAQLTDALRRAGVSGWVLPALHAPASRAALLRQMLRLSGAAAPRGQRPMVADDTCRFAPVTAAAEVEQQEHDRYFAVTRAVGEPGVGFVAATVLAHLRAYENCLDMGVTLLSASDWELLFGGLTALVEIAGDGGAAPHVDSTVVPPLPQPNGWRGGYDPAARWLIGHQLFFALIQGVIVGLNWFAGAVADGSAANANAAADADSGLAFAAAFMRSSAAAMRFASDFAPADYEATVRPAMVPPAVRTGFSGLQTRDHAHLVRQFAALKPVLTRGASRGTAHDRFVDSVVAAYAAHEYICARFRGDVLPSLRMAATTRGRTQRSAVDVVREMMRARLALIDPPTVNAEHRAGTAD